MRKKTTKTKTARLRSLEVLRARIDRLDGRLVVLLNERERVALEIGRIKKGLGQRIYVPSRESQILRRVTDLNGGPLNKSSLHAIYRAILAASRQGQRRVRGARK